MHTHDLARREMIARLETYREKKRRIEILKYEQMNFPSVSAEEIIEGMALSSPLGTIKGTGISDRTMNIALSYCEKTTALNRELQSSLDKELNQLQQEVQDLEFYVGLLEQRERNIIQAHYFNGIPWNELAARLHISTRTLARWKNAGIDALVDYYRYHRSRETREGSRGT